MNTPSSGADNRRRWIALVAVLAVGGLVAFGAVKLIDAINTWPQRQAEELMRRHIADVLSGKRKLIFIDSSDQKPFLDQMHDLADVQHLALSVEYGGGTDQFLKQIAGLSGLESLSLVKNDVTDEGMEYVATFPDLKSLTLFGVSITVAGLAKLQQSPHLESLSLTPRQGTESLIPAALAIPHLRKLALSNRYENWVEAIQRHTDEAQQLEELRLSATALDEQQLATLRQKLPNCQIKTMKHD